MLQKSVHVKITQHYMYIKFLLLNILKCEKLFKALKKFRSLRHEPF